MNQEPIDKLLLKDKVLRCCDCGDNFTFTADEQKFFTSKQLSEPRRCPRCRKIRRLTLVPDESVRKHVERY